MRLGIHLIGGKKALAVCCRVGDPAAIEAGGAKVVFYRLQGVSATLAPGEVFGESRIDCARSGFIGRDSTVVWSY